MKFDTNSDMEQEEEALYYYSSNKNEIFQTQDDTLFIKPGITAYNLRVSVYESGLCADRTGAV